MLDSFFDDVRYGELADPTSDLRSFYLDLNHLR